MITRSIYLFCTFSTFSNACQLHCDWDKKEEHLDPGLSFHSFSLPPQRIRYIFNESESKSIVLFIFYIINIFKLSKPNHLPVSYQPHRTILDIKWLLLLFVFFFFQHLIRYVSFFSFRWFKPWREREKWKKIWWTKTKRKKKKKPKFSCHLALAGMVLCHIHTHTHTTHTCTRTWPCSHECTILLKTNKQVKDAVIKRLRCEQSLLR